MSQSVTPMNQSVAPPPQLSDLVRNERLKLSAAYVNAMASGLFLTGVVAPAIALVYGVNSPAGGSGLAVAIVSPSAFAVSLVLHYLARKLLLGLVGTK